MDTAGQGNGPSAYMDFDTGHRCENLNAVGRLADKRQFPEKVQENPGALGGRHRLLWDKNEGVFRSDCRNALFLESK
jgi:hypothetical protein